MNNDSKMTIIKSSYQSIMAAQLIIDMCSNEVSNNPQDKSAMYKYNATKAALYYCLDRLWVEVCKAIDNPNDQDIADYLKIAFVSPRFKALMDDFRKGHGEFMDKNKEFLKSPGKTYIHLDFGIDVTKNE